MSQPAVEFTCHQLSQSYVARGGVVVALDRIDLQVAAHEFLCIVGPSGCGKTTLLKLISGIQQPSEGTIEFAAPPPAHASPSTDVPRSAMVFQDHGLFPWMTVLDNVAFGLETQGVGKAERRAAALAWLEKIGLVSFARNYPHELSGGMRQRAALARAFLTNAPLLLMDEPFGALDSQMRLLLQAELLQQWTENRKTVVYVTHDVDEALRFGDRVLVMSRRPGRILADYAIRFPRPRTLQSLGHADVLELKWKIWQIIEAEVQQGLMSAASHVDSLG